MTNVDEMRSHGHPWPTPDAAWRSAVLLVLAPLALLAPPVGEAAELRNGQILSREACTDTRSGHEADRQRIAEQWRLDEAAARR